MDIRDLLDERDRLTVKKEELLNALMEVANAFQMIQSEIKLLLEPNLHNEEIFK